MVSNVCGQNMVGSPRLLQSMEIMRLKLRILSIESMLSIRKGLPFQDKDEYHCFICYECAEKALGRKLTLEDINDSMFNGPFKKFYFKQEQ